MRDPEKVFGRSWPWEDLNLPLHAHSGTSSKPLSSRPTCCQCCASAGNGYHSEAALELTALLSPAPPSLQLLPEPGITAGSQEGLSLLLACPEAVCIGLERLHGSFSKRLPVPARTQPAEMSSSSAGHCISAQLLC